MFAFIRGSVAWTEEDQLILENNGIGYQIQMPLSDLDRIRGQEGELTVYTFFQSRDDGVFLFGFLKKEELSLFKLLIGVNGVGPKAALSILTELPPNDLRFAIAGEDVKAISRAQGVGKKTAERIILDLKDKISPEDLLSSESGADTLPAGGEASLSDHPEKRDAILALQSLGYALPDIRKAMGELPADAELTTEDWIREVLKRIGLNL